MTKELLQELFELSAARVREIPEDLFDAGRNHYEIIAAPFADYFFRVARELVLYLDEYEFVASGAMRAADSGTLMSHNQELYRDILPENYGNSYANPAYCVSQWDVPEIPDGKEIGQILSAVVYELRAMIPALYEQDPEAVCIRLDLFLALYTQFTQAYAGYVERRDLLAQNNMEDAAFLGTPVPSLHSVRDALYSYVYDYMGDAAKQDRRAALTVTPIVPGSVAYLASCEPLEDPKVLFYTGEYITQNEWLTAEHLATLPEEIVDKMATTFTEGYRIGFETTGKDLSSKSVVSIEYHLGFERMVRKAIGNFHALGKEVILSRAPASLFAISRGRGCSGADPNPQYTYDHREDLALILNRDLHRRRVDALRNAYRSGRKAYAEYAGPAVLEAFGEPAFSPVSGAYKTAYDKTQQRLVAEFRTKASKYYNDAIIGSNRSFTIIDCPLPSIALSEDAPVNTPWTDALQQRYEEIFDAVIEINTLDYKQYQTIQQHLIDALNEADTEEIIGRGDNHTRLTVNLWKLSDPSKEAIFENCVADVNIPVGEVFTSPVLGGTNGVLHVTQVYLEGLLFKDLEITFVDGCISDYHCGNYVGQTADDGHVLSAAEADALGRRYIEENILFHHETLPMGEAAIGTNTTAYAAGIRYGISGRLPILIAEKTGPHFAVGDTCYSNEEENRMFNPDGKEIVAKENDYSRLRDTDPMRAYFGCHTDITIPYNELGEIAAVHKDGTRVTLIRDGRFVLPGTEALNIPLDGLQS